MSTTVTPSVLPSVDQAAAIEAIETWYYNAPSNPYMALGGLAGTGKSTIASLMAKQFEENSQRVVFSAPTGKAAAVLRQKGAKSAHTLHSLLYRVAGVTEDDDGKEQIVFVNKDWTASCDLLIVDEASMVTTKLFRDILDRRVRALFIGDHGQLPPVGGNPRIMENAHFRLEKIHRQAEGSGILRVAHAARTGTHIDSSFNDHDVKVGRVRSLDHAATVAKDNGADQVIVATNSERHRMNRIWRGQKAEGKHPRVGERLMCLANNRMENLWNGQTYTVVSEDKIAGSTGIYTIKGEDDGLVRRKVSIFLPALHDPDMEQRELLQNGANLFTWAYACTGHKMQGSQNKRVFVLDNPFREADKWRYTSYTRAEEFLIIARYT